jgi:hypothetical protein
MFQATGTLPELQVNLAADAIVMGEMSIPPVSLAWQIAVAVVLGTIGLAHIIGAGWALTGLDEAIGRQRDLQDVQEFVDKWRTLLRPLTELDTQTATELQTDYDELEQKMKVRLPRKTKTRRTYLRYGFLSDVKYYLGGFGLKAPSWATSVVFRTGWEAKMYCSLYWKGPRNAIYVIVPHGNTLVYFNGPAKKQLDTYITDPPLMLPGGAPEYYFPNGTGPGTVLGPIPIPEGQLHR